MQFNIRAKNLKLTPTIEDYFRKKISGLEKFAGNQNSEILRVDAEAGRTTRHHQSGDIFRAEINMSLAGKFFRVESENGTLYAAIDEARDKMELELKRFKTKNQTIFKRGARSIKKQFGISPLARFRKK